MLMTEHVDHAEHRHTMTRAPVQPYRRAHDGEHPVISVLLRDDSQCSGWHQREQWLYTSLCWYVPWCSNASCTVANWWH
jgi:hypothetical protein